jgi:Ser/Thr protein kinase RdoA (MazF antagonist)
MSDAALPGSQRPLTLADLNFDPPCLPDRQLLEIAAHHFGIRGQISHLPGERDQNARIRTADGGGFVLKVSSAGADPQGADFQARALVHIAEHDPGLPVPRMVRLQNGGLIAPFQSAAGEHQVRMLTYLPGILYQDGRAPSQQGLRGIGAFLGRLDRVLASFRHPAAGHWMPWDVTNGLVFNPQLKSLLSAEVRTMLEPAWRRLEHEVYPQLASLRNQIIHQDAHAANLLRPTVDDEAITGLIDFGDMVHGPLICELAVAIAHLLEGGGDPLRIITPVCAGYHSVYPLAGTEIALLPDLVIARLILTLQLLEFRRRNMAHPPRFVTDDQPGIIAALRALARMLHEGGPAIGNI